MDENRKICAADPYYRTLWLSLGTGFLTFIAGLRRSTRVFTSWCDGWHQKPMAGIVVHHDSVHASTVHVWSRHADHTVVCGGRYLHNLAGNPSVNYSGATIVTHLIDYGSGTRYEMGYACAIATVLFALMVGTNQIVQKAIRRVGE